MLFKFRRKLRILYSTHDGQSRIVVETAEGEKRETSGFVSLLIEIALIWSTHGSFVKSTSMSFEWWIELVLHTPHVSPPAKSSAAALIRHCVFDRELEIPRDFKAFPLDQDQNWSWEIFKLRQRTRVFYKNLTAAYIDRTDDDKGSIKGKEKKVTNQSTLE